MSISGRARHLHNTRLCSRELKTLVECYVFDWAKVVLQKIVPVLPVPGIRNSNIHGSRGGNDIRNLRESVNVGSPAFLFFRAKSCIHKAPRVADTHKIQLDFRVKANNGAPRKICQSGFVLILAAAVVSMQAKNG